MDKYNFTKLIQFCFSFFDKLLLVHMLHWKQCRSGPAGFYRTFVENILALLWIFKEFIITTHVANVYVFSRQVLAIKARICYKLIYKPSYCNFPESRKKILKLFFFI